MGLFGKKKKTESAAEAASVPASVPKAEEKAGSKKAKTRVSGLSQILHESVLETALDKFKANDAFIREVNGAPQYIGIALETQSIGGLDKKSRKDEAKGSIIECINSGKISTYINQDLMDAECICIIPDSATLNAMDEFSLLTGASYEFCAVDESGDVMLLNIRTTFQQISELVLKDGHIDDILGDPDSDDEDDDDDADFVDDVQLGVPVDNANDGDADDEIDVDDDDIPMDGDDIPEADADDIPNNDFDDDVETADDGWNPADDLSDVGDDDFDPYAAAVQPESVPEQTIPADLTDEVIVRKFYAGDLGLEVTSEPFDAQFIQNNPYVPFDVDREEGWINNQLNEMSRQANAELERVHKQNCWQMRERYFRLVSMACDRIRTDLDLNDPDTQYGQMYADIKVDKEEKLSRIDTRVSTRKSEIEASWKQRLQEVGMQAARDAQQKYRERYGQQHDRDIYNIENVEKASIEDDYRDDLHELQERRRVEAASLLDLSITEILSEISDSYTDCLEGERDLRLKYEAQMKQFVEDHREEDLARSRVLDEELRQREKADKVYAEQTEKIRQINEEHQREKEDLLIKIEDMRRENEDRLDRVKKSLSDTEEQAQDAQNKAQQRYDQLLEKYQNLDSIKEKEFEARLAELRDEKEALADRCDHMIAVHRRSNLMSIFLVIAVAIAMLTIGYIGGQWISTQQRTKLEQDRLLFEYQMDMQEQNGGAQSTDFTVPNAAPEDVDLSAQAEPETQAASDANETAAETETEGESEGEPAVEDAANETETQDNGITPVLPEVNTAE